MILHQQILHPKSGPHLPWLALHVETLTMALVSAYGDALRIQLIVQDSSALITSLETSITTSEIQEEIAADIRAQGATCIIADPISSSSLESSSLASCVYHLFNTLDGKTPAILHTGDPTALYLARPDTAILQHTEHFRSQVDLSVEGWAYWWQDAQNAFIRLTVEFAQACGHPVPAHIATAARYL
jgi:hypothetical protein